MVGADEIENNTYTLKNMQNGEQEVCSLKELIRITAQL
jgi:histidyl-tRNA synthetase